MSEQIETYTLKKSVAKSKLDDDGMFYIDAGDGNGMYILKPAFDALFVRVSVHRQQLREAVKKEFIEFHTEQLELVMAALDQPRVDHDKLGQDIVDKMLPHIDRVVGLSNTPGDEK